MNHPLMPKATAVWLIDNTTLSFRQVADFCGLHELEVQGIADGDVAAGVKGLDPVAGNQLDPEEIRRGERQPSREFAVDALQVKEIRKATGLSQARFARMIDVQLGTLRNWEQGRREPTGPAKALLRAIHNDPEHVLRALAG